MAACILNFLVSTVHHTHGNAISSKTPAEAFTFLSELVIPQSVEYFIDANNVPQLNASESLDDFKVALLAWFAKIADIDPDSAHATPRSKVRFL